MQSRLGHLTENTLVTAMERLQADLDELKNRQRVSGESGLLSYQTLGTQWDKSGTLTGTNAQQIFTVAFTNDGSQQFPPADLYPDIFVNGTDEAHRLPADGSAWSSGANSASYTVFQTQASMTDPTTTTWTLTLTYNGTITYNIRVNIIATCRGSFTIS